MKNNLRNRKIKILEELLDKYVSEGKADSICTDLYKMLTFNNERYMKSILDEFYTHHSASLGGSVSYIQSFFEMEQIRPKKKYRFEVWFESTEERVEALKKLI